jgi:hypothetical protein
MLIAYENRTFGIAAQRMPAIADLDVALTHSVAPAPQRRFKVSLYAQRHRTFKLEK